MADNAYYHCPPSGLILHNFEEASVCYQRSTGDTHILSAFPAQMLEILLKQPHSIEELAEITAQLCHVDASDEWRDTVMKTLHDLKVSKLIDSLPE